MNLVVVIRHGFLFLKPSVGRVPSNRDLSRIRHVCVTAITVTCLTHLTVTDVRPTRVLPRPPKKVVRTKRLVDHKMDSRFGSTRGVRLGRREDILDISSFSRISREIRRSGRVPFVHLISFLSKIKSVEYDFQLLN